MANINIKGVDQTTGQLRPISTDDSVVNNIGQQIITSVRNTFDYSGGVNQVQLLNPWSNPPVVFDPSILSLGVGTCTSWSPDDEYFAISNNNATPYLQMFQRFGDIFRELPTLSSLPSAGSVQAHEWSPNGEFFAYGNQSESPFIGIYQRSGSSFTRLANPASLPPSSVGDVKFSPNGEFLALAHNNAPFLTVYQRSGTTFTKIADPASLPTSNVGGVAWSPDGQYLAAGFTSAPFIHIYQRTGLTSFTKLADPASLPTATPLRLAWSPDGQLLGAGVLTSVGAIIYQQSGTTFTKLASGDTGEFINNASLPGAAAAGLTWSPDNLRLVVGTSTSPRINIYLRSGTTFTKLTAPVSLPTFSFRNCKWSYSQTYLSGGDNMVTMYKSSNTMPTSGVVIK